MSGFGRTGRARRDPIAGRANDCVHGQNFCQSFFGILAAHDNKGCSRVSAFRGQARGLSSFLGTPFKNFSFAAARRQPFHWSSRGSWVTSTAAMRVMTYVHVRCPSTKQLCRRNPRPFASLAPSAVQGVSVVMPTRPAPAPTCCLKANGHHHALRRAVGCGIRSQSIGLLVSRPQEREQAHAARAHAPALPKLVLKPGMEQTNHRRQFPPFYF
jgi:hypothetical protein